jgi:hypothetical protein
MKYSQIEWYWQALAWILFAAGMLAVYWFLYNLVYVWLPTDIAAMLGFLIGGLAFGFNLGRWSLRREYRNSRPAGSTERAANQRFDRL